MSPPQRQSRLKDRYAVVDGITFKMPINSQDSPALMAVYSIDALAAAKLIPGNEVHPLRLWKRGLLVITIIDYRTTDIGKYIEYSIAIACTHGAKPAPRLLPVMLMKTFGTGQYVWDLPVSTEISVKGGRGIWGMPKHQASLDFLEGQHWISSQYDLDGQMMMRVDVRRPKSAWLPVNMGAANYCAFRGMLMKSNIYFKGKLGMAPLKTLGISADPLIAGYFPSTQGVLDDYFECWFQTEAQPTLARAGLADTYPLGQSTAWLAPPVREPGWDTP
jgi:hypothetical protein